MNDTKIISQREIYLNKIKKEAMIFWQQVLNEYNQGISPEVIAKSHVNPRTKKPYSRITIHKIIKTMRERLNN